MRVYCEWLTKLLKIGSCGCPLLARYVWRQNSKRSALLGLKIEWDDFRLASRRQILETRRDRLNLKLHSVTDRKVDNRRVWPPLWKCYRIWRNVNISSVHSSEISVIKTCPNFDTIYALLNNHLISTLTKLLEKIKNPSKFTVLLLFLNK